MMPDAASVISEAQAGEVHVLPIRVYYEDTDSGGVVYYANYLRYAERARTELLRSIGIDHKYLLEEEGLAFIVRRCDADFRKPARLDDSLEIHTTMEDVKGASAAMVQTVRCGAEVLVVMRVQIACLNTDGRATRLPRPVVARFKQFAYRN